MAKVSMALRDRFHAVQYQSVQTQLTESDGIVTDSILMTLEKIAGEGSHAAQVNLAHLYTGLMEFIGDFELTLDDEQLDLAKGRYWALKASAGEEFEAAMSAKSDYVTSNLARVLLKVGDDQCRLRALNLLVRAISGGDRDAVAIMEENFAGFDLENFLSGYAPSPLQEPVRPPVAQKDLF